MKYFSKQSRLVIFFYHAAGIEDTAYRLSWYVCCAWKEMPREIEARNQKEYGHV